MEALLTEYQIHTRLGFRHQRLVDILRNHSSGVTQEQDVESLAKQIPMSERAAVVNYNQGGLEEFGFTLASDPG